MKRKDRLYTVNKWNKPAFMPDENLFVDGGNTWTKLALNTPQGAFMASQGFDPTEAYKNSKNAFGLSKINNPFSKGNLSSGVGAGLLSAGAGMIGGLAGNAISGRLQSGAGSAISSLGSTVGGAISTVNPLLGTAVNVGSQLLGGLANRAFGSKLNEENIQEVKENNTNTRSSANGLAGATSSADFLSNAGNVDMGFDFNKSFIGERCESKSV